MRNVTSVALAAGPLVVLGYLLGALPFPYLFERRSLRRALAEENPWVAANRPGRRRADAAVITVMQALAAVLAATIAWHVSRYLAPGTTFSRVALLFNQVLAVWQSVALWVGLAAVVGQIAPPWRRFRATGSGLAPAMAVVFVYAPMVFGAGVASYGIGLVLTRTPRAALVVALPMVVGFEWAMWITDTQSTWGTVNGPELSLWVTVLASVLFARWLKGDVLATSADTRPPTQ